MGCVIKYKGQLIPEEQFLQYLNKQITINNLFNENETLANSVCETLGFTGNISLESNLKNTGKTEQELIKYLQEKYPEIKLNISNNPAWEKGDNIFNQEEYNNQVNYRLKVTEILLSDKAKQVFEKGKKNNWSLDKILTELQIPKEQKKLVLDLGITDREQLALELASNYSYTVEINTAKTDRGTIGAYYEYSGRYYNGDGIEVSKEEAMPNRPTEYYSNLTVPGGTNYTENEISTPLIIPSIKGHAQFSTDNGIGWFRSDEQVLGGNNKVETKDYTAYLYGDDSQAYLKTEGGNKTKTRRILEVQSDLFQKGRDKKDLQDRIETVDYKGKQYHIVAEGNTSYFLSSVEPTGIAYTTPEDIDFDDEGRPYQSGREDIPSFEEIEVPKSEIKSTSKQKNHFLQLLNKNNNWVTFFIKSIIQDSAKKGYEKVLFPKGETAAKVEGHETIAEEIRKIDEQIDKIKERISNNKLDIENQGRLESDLGNLERAKETLKWQEANNAPTWAIERSKENIKNLEYSISKRAVDNTQSIQLKKLEDRKANLKSQGIEKLKPIEGFYEIKVGNILEKQFGKDNVKTITDEYGNQWREITINQARDLQNILLQKDEANRIIGQANIKAMTVLVDAINKKADTIPHEYAHHYIAWFRNTPIVQEGVKRFGSEEALVQAIGEQVVKQKGEAYNWWKKFTNWILNLLSDKQVLQILTDSFLNRTDLNNFTYSEITPQQKATAQQLYSQYLEQTGKQDIEGFQKFVNKYNINQDLQNLHLTTPVLESLYENSSKSKDFITFVKDLKKMIAIWQNSGRTNEEILEMIKCL